jgi:hypothetical protein
MIIEKIDITKTTLNVKDSDRIVQIDSQPSIDVNNMNGMTEINRTTYTIAEIKHPITSKNIKYAVRIDDLELFQDLIRVSKGQWQKKEIEAENRGKDYVRRHEIPRVERQYSAWFAKLPWYKRLFYKSTQLAAIDAEQAPKGEETNI